MTLLELLVKELPGRGGWPKGAAEFFIHEGIRRRGFFYDAKGQGDGCFYSIDTIEVKYVENCPGDIPGYSVTREQYEAAIAAQQPVWNGEGLPPIGSKVESFINGEWKLVKVVYVGEPGGEYEALVFDVKTTKPAWSDLFRPILTEAERKREEVGQAIYEAINWNADGERVSASRMEDYRKAYDAIAAGKIPGVELSK